MNDNAVTELGLYVAVLALASPLLGFYCARVFSGLRTAGSRLLEPLERLAYRLCGIDPAREMRWTEYTGALLAFNALGLLVVLVLQLFQMYLPLNPQHLPNVPWHLAFNTAVSFMTNTNWQSYAGESTLSYLTQMVGLGVQNFASAATGIAVLVALTRGLRCTMTATIGNFWVDLTRATVYVLLPLALVLAVVLVGQGVVQSLAPARTATTLAGQTQMLPLGPAASQVAIKQLGSNGGGYFGANSAHPFENPTPLTNFLEALSILLIPSALVFTFGMLVKARRHALIVWVAMSGLFLVGLGVALWAESSANPALQGLGFWEGKETRIGLANSVLWSTATTAASSGSVNAMHASLSPLAALVALVNMVMGEVVFGGVGAGMYGMVMFVIITVFIAGLMVGRTPEYLGKKIEAFEVRMALIAVLAPTVLILICTAWALSVPGGRAAILNPGPHGLMEVLYAFTSAANNNGSAFAGLATNTAYYNVLLAACMLVGRFAVIIPVLAVAGSLARKKSIPPSPGTFPTDRPLFGVLLVSVILIVSALSFFPVLCLGSVVEYLLMQGGRVF
ncbi:MAG: potassium-transporting ATPase subunit KdpA [bacterium]|nr:potassium-transporting ATPase subunit KdpA [bacterium]